MNKWSLADGTGSWQPAVCLVAARESSVWHAWATNETRWSRRSRIFEPFLQDTTSSCVEFEPVYFDLVTCDSVCVCLLIQTKKNLLILSKCPKSLNFRCKPPWKATPVGLPKWPSTKSTRTALSLLLVTTRSSCGIWMKTKPTDTQIVVWPDTHITCLMSFFRTMACSLCPPVGTRLCVFGICKWVRFEF